jgi:hypothetical protein
MGNPASLKSLTYTSRARLDLTTDDLLAIQETARHRNALEGVTGLLIYDGTRFLQVVEGGNDAIDDLLARLLRDDRHTALEVRDERWVVDRSFPDWSMELLRVNTPFHEARNEIDHVLPAGTRAEVRSLILTMAAAAGAPVTLRD